MIVGAKSSQYVSFACLSIDPRESRTLVFHDPPQNSLIDKAFDSS
jgi:hypothetical protein